MIVTDISKLKEECSNVSIIQAYDIISNLEDELIKNSGLGLSANQIGIDAKVCIIRTKSKIDLVNPKIIKKYDLIEFKNEGCLSFKGQYITTKRFNEVVIQDLIYPAGIILTGIDSIVAQHEIGHLYGKVMFDYEITKPSRNELCWCGSKKKYKKCHLNKFLSI